MTSEDNSGDVASTSGEQGLASLGRQMVGARSAGSDLAGVAQDKAAPAVSDALTRVGLADFARAYHVQRVIEGIYRSGEGGGWVDVSQL